MKISLINEWIQKLAVIISRKIKKLINIVDFILSVIFLYKF